MVRILLLAACLLVSTSASAQRRQQGPLPTPLGDEEFAVLSAFFDYDMEDLVEAEPAALCAMGACGAVQDRGNHVLEKFVLSGSSGPGVPGYLAIPKNGEAPYPLVFLHHGMNGSKQDFWEEGRASALKDELLERGIAVVALDAPFHGERSQELGFSQPPSLVLGGRIHRLRNMSVNAILEHRRTLDWLETRKDIDSTRIGSFGFSQGAMHTLYLGAVEPRLVACVVWASPTRVRDPLFYPGHFARRVRNCSVLMVAGDQDPFYTRQQAETIFGLVPNQDKRLLVYEGGHRIVPAAVPTAVEWLTARLGGVR